jgi:hypothetical protein
LSQPPSDLLVPLHRHAPKRHVAVSFVVAHEGCGTRQQSSGDEDSEAGKHGRDDDGGKVDRTGGPQSGDLHPPPVLGYPPKTPTT